MRLVQSILDKIQRRQLKCYVQLLRMDDSRCPKIIHQWTLQGRKKAGRPLQ